MKAQLRWYICAFPQTPIHPGSARIPIACLVLHNGEINTIRGNVDRMMARGETMHSPVVAMFRISPGRDAGTRFTHAMESFSVIRQASANEMPISLGALASSESLVARHSGQTSSFRNFSTRFMPLSSLTLFSAFSTV